MRTRSLTVFVDEEADKEIVVMYRQMDGYPEGHGKDLCEFLDGIHIVNGIPAHKKQERLANGMGCLSAQTVAHFKDEVGSFYLHPAGTRDLWEDYIYYVSVKDDLPFVEIRDADDRTVLFKGNPKQVLEWIKSHGKE